MGFSLEPGHHCPAFPSKHFHVLGSELSRSTQKSASYLPQLLLDGERVHFQIYQALYKAEMLYQGPLRASQSLLESLLIDTENVKAA